MTSLAADESMMVIGRIILGIGGGVSTVVVPLYLNEISPSNYRGAVGVLHQLSITIGNYKLKIKIKINLKIKIKIK